MTGGSSIVAWPGAERSLDRWVSLGALALGAFGVVLLLLVR